MLVLAAEEADVELANNLTELLIASVAEQIDAAIIGKEEFQAILQRQDEESLDCLETQACLGRVAVQLGLSEVISGTIGHRDNHFALHLGRTDVTTGEMITRVFLEVPGGLSELLEALRAAVPQLFEVPPEVGGLTISCDLEGASVRLDGEPVGRTPLDQLEVAAGSHQLEVTAEGYRPWSTTIEIEAGESTQLVVDLAPIDGEEEGSVDGWVAVSAWALIGVGTGSLVAAIVVGVLSQAGLPEAPETTRQEALDILSVQEREALAANVLFGVGGAMAVGGALIAIFARHRVFGLPRSDNSEASRLTLGWGRVAWRF